MKDNCELCLGFQGGVRGNENRVEGVVVCDYCHSILVNKLLHLTQQERATIEAFINKRWRRS